MASSPFNIIDFTILGIMGISILIGIFRGATRSVLGIAGWAGSFAVVIYGFPLFRPLGRQYIKTPMIADLVVALVLFVLSLAVFILISRLISDRIKGSVFSGLDRSLGLVFGFAMGTFILFLSYLGLGFFYPPNHLPDAIKYSRLAPWVAQGANEFKLLIPKDYLPQADFSHPLINPLDAKDLLEHSLPTLEETVKNLSTLKPTSPKKPVPEYNQKEKQDLEKLIEDNGTET